MWKLLRVAVLLLLLVIVGAGALLDRLSTTDWDRPLWVGVFPINGDDSVASRRYIESLAPASFAPVEAFFAAQARRYALGLTEPVRIELYPPVTERPPALGRNASAPATAWWSLKLRYYAWRHGKAAGRAPPQIRVFVLYHDPEASPEVPHSLGLQKGLVGVVYAFADRGMSGGNGAVIAHEVLHTLGASDKYDLATGAPRYPEGYGEPERTPRHPQRYAEIMGARIAIDPETAEVPESLGEVVLGPATAREIRWVRD